MTPLAIVLITLAVLAAPPIALARLLRVYPRAPLVYLALAPACAAALVLVTPYAVWLVVAIDVALGVVALFDLQTLPRRKALSAQREAGRIASLRKPHRVTLTLTNQSPRALMVKIRDGVPHELDPEPDEFQRRLAARSRTTLHYVLRPRRRGAFALAADVPAGQ